MKTIKSIALSIVFALALIVGCGGSARAEIKDVQMKIAGYLCGN